VALRRTRHLITIGAASLVLAAPVKAADSYAVRGLLCIHRYEGAWTANTGNGFYGGLQMNWDFMRTYGREFLSRYGTADRWPPSVQIQVALRAWHSRGFNPWPNTRRICGV